MKLSFSFLRVKRVARETAIEKLMGLGKLANPEPEDDYSLNAGRR